jgi:hypothetical protein
MPWLRKPSAPITLDDGRVFTTLCEAGRYMLVLAEPHQRNGQRQYFAEAMKRARRDQTMPSLAIAEERLRAALQAEGVLDRVHRR